MEMKTKEMKICTECVIAGISAYLSTEVDRGK